MATSLPRPNADEFGPFGKYMRLVPDGDIAAILERQRVEMGALLGGVSEAQSLAHHPPYTWSIRQVLGHVTDAERIFAYRALRLARGDATPLPGFDENVYAVAGEFDRWPLAELAADFDAVRHATLRLVGHLDARVWANRGTVSNTGMTVGGMIHVIAGHCKHHLEIVQRRLAAEH